MFAWKLIARQLGNKARTSVRDAKDHHGELQGLVRSHRTAVTLIESVTKELKISMTSKMRRQLQTFFSIFYFAINSGALISTFITPILR